MPGHPFTEVPKGHWMAGPRKPHDINRNCSKYSNMDIIRNCRFNNFLR